MIDSVLNSRAVRSDDRARLGAAILGSVLIASMRAIEDVLVALVIVMLLCIASYGVSVGWMRAPLPILLRDRFVQRILKVNILSILIWLTLPWVWSASQGWSWQSEAAEQAMVITLRLNAIVMWCSLWLSQMVPESLATGARALGAPVRLAQLLYLTLRVLETLSTSHARLKRAMLVRGSARGITRRLQCSAYLLVLLIAEGLRQADIFVAALKARGSDLKKLILVMSVPAKQSRSWSERAWTWGPVLLLLWIAVER